MGEYGREQRNQLSRTIVCNTNNNVIKRFTDNRKQNILQHKLCSAIQEKENKMRLSMVNSIKPPSNSVAQRVTEINYTQNTLTYWTAGAHTNTFDAGVHSEAYLDPSDPKTGSRTAAAPQPSPYTNGNWPTLYQGHLLNANLGGQAINANIFPVSPEFNSQHSSVVEDEIKYRLLALNADQNDPAIFANYINRRLYYSVQVINPHFWGTLKPRHIGDTIFRCSMNYTFNNNGPGAGTGSDPSCYASNVDLHVPGVTKNTLNGQLETLGWGPDNVPTYTMGPLAGPPHAPNSYIVLDGAGAVVPNMLIQT